MSDERRPTDPTGITAKACIRETEEFFLSEYYMLLTNYYGHTMLRRLKEEVSV